MSQRRDTPATYQRNAFVPGLLGAVVLVLAPILFARGLDGVVLYPVAILALIVAWFAFQAKHWWWVAVFVIVAVVWNPVYPLPLDGDVWLVVQFVAAATFLAAGATIRVPRE